jgi:hypothetical protein
MGASPCFYAVIRSNMHQVVSQNRTDREKRVQNPNSLNFTMLLRLLLGPDRHPGTAHLQTPACPELLVGLPPQLMGPFC